MKTKQSAPGAIIIHVLGGIHEIYFPYILMNPLVIIAPIIGNMVSIFWFNMMDCGLVGPASPGSIIAYLMMTPGSDIWKYWWVWELRQVFHLQLHHRLSRWQAERTVWKLHSLRWQP